MDNFFQNVNMNNNLNSDNFPKTQDNIQKARHFYNEFVNQMNKSDFCNTSRRYVAELAYVRKLKNLYMEQNQLDFFKEMADRENEIIQKLEKDFGITLKD